MATAIHQIDLDRADAMLIGPTWALRNVIAQCIANERKRSAYIALALDSGRGNEKVIADAILAPDMPHLGDGRRVAVTQDKRHD